MKNLLFYVMLVALFLMLLSAGSCSTNDDPSPKISISQLTGDVWNFQSAEVKDNINPYTLDVSDGCDRSQIPSAYNLSLYVLDLDFKTTTELDIVFACQASKETYNWVLKDDLIVLSYPIAPPGNEVLIEILELTPTLLKVRMTSLGYQPIYTFER